MSACPICQEETTSDEMYGSNVNVRHIDCPRCGKYQISVIAASQYQAGLGDKGSRKRANASAYIWANQGISLGAADEDRLLKLAAPSFQRRAEIILFEIERRTEYAGQFVQVHLINWLSLTWCMNRAELEEIIRSLEVKGTLEREARVHSAGAQPVLGLKITPEGWAYLEKLKQRNPLSQQCFVAMWFHKCMTPIYEDFIAPAIRDAGYEPNRIDKKEHFGKIDDEIVAEIRRSRFVVADFTGHRAGVYYEAGFAHGLNIPVIFTCRKKELHRLHFDIRQYVTIDWETPEGLAKRLTQRITGTIGWGPLVSESGSGK